MQEIILRQDRQELVSASLVETSKTMMILQLYCLGTGSEFKDIFNLTGWYIITGPETQMQ